MKSIIQAANHASSHASFESTKFVMHAPLSIARPFGGTISAEKARLQLYQSGSSSMEKSQRARFSIQTVGKFRNKREQHGSCYMAFLAFAYVIAIASQYGAN
jgi:hypothetical protein